MANLELDEVADIFETLRKERESETIEFKEAKNNFDFDDLGRYFSALSNEASLRKRPYGWLVFGVDDEGNPVGTSYRTDRKGLDNLKTEVRNRINDFSTFTDIYELFPDGRRIIMFQIPAAGRIPVAWMGSAYGREGDSITNLSDQKMRKIVENGTDDWSARICKGATMSDLSGAAITAAKKIFAQKNVGREYTADLLIADDSTFLLKLGLMTEGSLTNGAMALFASPDAASKVDPAPEVAWILRDRNGETISGEVFRGSLLLGMEHALALVRNPRYIYAVDPDSTNTIETNRYDMNVLREIFFNAIAHQDYTIKGRINLIETEIGMDIINPGDFLPGSVEVLLGSGYMPPYYRNRLLTTAMKSIGMIETYGGGIMRRMRVQKDRYMPLPDYNLGDKTVGVHIYGNIIDQNYSMTLFASRDMDIRTAFLLDRVQKRLPISSAQSEELSVKGFVGGKWPAIHTAPPGRDASAKADMMEKARTKGYEGCILSLIAETGSANRSDINELMLGMLPSGMTYGEKEVRIRNIIAKMSREGKIVNTGGRRMPKWILGDAARSRMPRS
ncbi:MAG: putative DNA binding domain-containing protein [Candidatus Methanoplasma sp.]|jgi:ATP-dependent DNA helicase RecG|nr:putative DNA binding domain-containing protein [Candidatus Methanoplasma sp.]